MTQSSPRIAALCAAAILAAAPGAASAAILHWDETAGGNGNYYEIVNIGSASWTSARAQALGRSHLGLSGYLASIASAAEMDFLIDGFGPFTQHIWIGAEDQAVDGAFRWADGPDAGVLLSYTNWYPGEPNGGAFESYVHITEPQGRWNDVSAFTNFPAMLVEYGLGSDPVGVSAAVPAPQAGALFFGALGLLALRARRREG